MRRYELGMALTYAKGWGVSDAVREFFQNALDEQKENPENKMYWEYNQETKTLIIANKHSKLSPASLLMGSSSKEGKNELIGEHGEGYKVATIVLLREGKTVKIYNNTVNEVWTSRVVRSRRYGADIGCFDISKDFFNKEYDLVVKIEGVTEEDWTKIVESNLHLQDNIGETISADDATILLEDKYSGKIYVEGLYVCTKSFLQWGYNLPANLIKLDRDRGLVDSFDLQWTLGNVISKVEDVDFISDHLDFPDLQYVHYSLKRREESVSDKVSDRVYENFKEEYGEDAVPVSDTDSFNLYAKAGKNPVMVKDNIKTIIEYKDRDYENQIPKSIDDQYEEWRKEARRYLPKNLVAQIDILWKKK